jgi:hypothetical protein
MKKRKLTLVGKVDRRGGVLIDNQELLKFGKSWLNKRVSVTFTIDEQGASGAMKGLYYRKIVPDFKQGFWDNGMRMTEAKTEAYMRSLCPILWDETPDPETGEYKARLREIKELDNSEFVAYIEHLVELSGELFETTFVSIKHRIRELENELRD